MAGRRHIEVTTMVLENHWLQDTIGVVSIISEERRMEIMINSLLVREPRKKRSWSQDQLAIASGLSLRTVQRIGNARTSSLESNQALAAVFELDVASLHIDAVKNLGDRNVRRGRKLGMLGNTIGLASAYSGITYSLVYGDLGGL